MEIFYAPPTIIRLNWKLNILFRLRKNFLYSFFDLTITSMHDASYSFFPYIMSSSSKIVESQLFLIFLTDSDDLRYVLQPATLVQYRAEHFRYFLKSFQW